ncbi:hypothetical protein [Actinomadura parmotrematis]|uniref:Lipoprotein n=1 Tax=Actinomadura parmotrematis TaxID=2864039 RepID=A0ABS7FQ57_9ACTN|nr:hypothetical protein [Actinomadura parmotrematis]MBW8482100.1 hypothetical protein [Actinomadura parmotrematis]
MEYRRWAIPAVAALTATGITLTACGTENGRQRNTGAGSAVTPAADPSEQPTASPDSTPATLEVAAVTKIGKVVTDGEGRTLYRFDNDTARPPASTCEDQCATTWPPVWASTQDVRVKGVDKNLVGKVKRPDGKWQVTLGGWPLYTYAKDESPGDAKGQGVGGTWYAAAPDGKKAGAKKAAAPAPTPTTPSTGRWAGWTVIKARQDPKLGLILTDARGRTMYRFDKDKAKPPTSTCFKACKKAWPPVVFNGWKHLKLTGVKRSAVKFIERTDDGKCQLTINGWPMYFYAKDTKAGDTKGQGVGGVWFASTPEGKKAKAAAGSDAGGSDAGGSDAGGADGGYGGGY